MKKYLISLGVVASLYGFSFSVSKNVNTKFNFSKSISGSVLSDDDTKKANNSYNYNCYNAFSISSPTDTQYIPSIITQIQNEDFYLYITNKCENTENLNITLINKNTGEEISDYDINSILKQPVIKVKVPNAYKDLLVHFSYDKYTKVDCNSSEYATAKVNSNGYEVTAGASAGCYIKTSHEEENSTDDFAVRPKQFNISADSSVFVGKPLKIDITTTGENGKISTNYNANDINLNTTITDPKTHLSYYFDIVNGKLAHHRFYFSKASDDVKIDINEKVGQEWAIVDSDDTSDDRRLISKGESNSIKVNETSKSWAGVSTGDKANNPSTKTITSDIRNNSNRNLKFRKVNW